MHMMLLLLSSGLFRRLPNRLNLSSGLSSISPTLPRPPPMFFKIANQDEQNQCYANNARKYNCMPDILNGVTCVSATQRHMEPHINS